MGFSQLINQEPAEYAFVDLLRGTTNSLTLRFVGNDGSALNILDPNITILLLIRKKPMAERI